MKNYVNESQNKKCGVSNQVFTYLTDNNSIYIRDNIHVLFLILSELDFNT